MEYHQLFSKLSDDLKNNNFIEVTKNFVGSEVLKDDYSYQLILEHYKITMFEKLLSFYYSISGCHIEWNCDLNKHPDIKKFNSEDSSVSGEIVIRPIGYMLEFDKKMQADWWLNNLEKDEKAALLNFRYFDFNDDNIRVGYIMQNNVIDENQFYFILQESTGFSPVELTFDEYLKNWDKFKGYQGWQQNIFFKNSTNYKRMIHYIHQLFP